MFAFINFVERFLRIDDSLPILQLRLRSVWVAGAFFALLQVVNFCVLTLNYGRWTYDHTILVVGCSVLAGVIALLRWYKVPHFYVIAYTVLLLAATVSSAIPDQAGINSADVPFLILGPLVAVFISGRKGVFFFTACTVTILCYLYWVSINSPEAIASGGRARDLNHFAMSLLALILSFVISLLIGERASLLLDRMHLEKESAEMVAAARNDFIARIGHEFRTPLSTMILTARNLRHRAEGQVFVKELSALEASSQALLHLLNNALDYARYNSDYLHPNYAPLDLRRLIDDVVDMLMPKADEKHLRLNVDVSESVPEWIVSDALMLRQVLVNLTDNAIKYTDEGGIALRVNMLIGGGGLRFEVADTGAGIPAELQEEVFERFRRGAVAAGSGADGVGLGLAISNQHSIALGGRLDMTSVVGHGSEFCLEIPLRMAPNEVGVARDYSNSHRKRVVLLVEDNAFSRLMLKEQLVREGMEVIEAGGVDEAVGLLSTGAFDLILTDLNLGERKGTELAVRARERGVKVPIVVLTAGGGAEDVALCHSAGVDQVVVKPLTQAEFRYIASCLLG